MNSGAFIWLALQLSYALGYSGSMTGKAILEGVKASLWLWQSGYTTRFVSDGEQAAIIIVLALAGAKLWE